MFPRLQYHILVTEKELSISKIPLILRKCPLKYISEFAEAALSYMQRLSLYKKLGKFYQNH